MNVDDANFMHGFAEMDATVLYSRNTTSLDVRLPFTTVQYNFAAP